MLTIKLAHWINAKGSELTFPDYVVVFVWVINLPNSLLITLALILIDFLIITPLWGVWVLLKTLLQHRPRFRRYNHSRPAATARKKEQPKPKETADEAMAKYEVAVEKINAMAIPEEDKIALLNSKEDELLHKLQKLL